jgi:hypothetical protein
MDPVASFCAGCVEKGLVKRVVSELQATVPTAMAAKTTARDNDFERNDPTTEDMASPPVRNTTMGELTPGG